MKLEGEEMKMTQVRTVGELLALECSSMSEWEAK